MLLLLLKNECRISHFIPLLARWHPIVYILMDKNKGWLDGRWMKNWWQPTTSPLPPTPPTPHPHPHPHPHPPPPHPNPPPPTPTPTPPPPHPNPHPPPHPNPHPPPHTPHPTHTHSVAVFRFDDDIPELNTTYTSAVWLLFDSMKSLHIPYPMDMVHIISFLRKYFIKWFYRPKSKYSKGLLIAFCQINLQNLINRTFSV